MSPSAPPIMDVAAIPHAGVGDCNSADTSRGWTCPPLDPSPRPDRGIVPGFTGSPQGLALVASPPAAAAPASPHKGITKSLSGVGLSTAASAEHSGRGNTGCSGPLDLPQSLQTTGSHPILPSYSSGQETTWQRVIAYEACARMCLLAASKGSSEAQQFLHEGCLQLRTCFGLTQVLLQPNQGAMKDSINAREDTTESTAQSKRSVGILKVQVRRVRTAEKPRQPSPKSSRRYVEAGAQYMKQVSGRFFDRVTGHKVLQEGPQEGFYCLLRLKSGTLDESIRIQPGTGETITMHPESAGDDLMLDVFDTKGWKGKLAVPLSAIDDEHRERPRWVPFYQENEQECAGKVQLLLTYTINGREGGHAKYTQVGETLAYDVVLETALKVIGFDKRNLRLSGPWKWLLEEFLRTYAISEHYAALRYLTHIMDIAIPTQDCLELIYALLLPIVKARQEDALSRQERRILADVQEHINQLLAFTFENYKSLDEASPTGVSDAFMLMPGKLSVQMSAAPALIPALQVYKLFNDILSPEAQNTLRGYFQTAAKKRCRRYLSESDEFVVMGAEGIEDRVTSVVAAYAKMRLVCQQLSSEIRNDIKIHRQGILPSSIDLPTLVAEIYNVDLGNRLRAFLKACPPSSPSHPVVDLLHATADFQRDLETWGVRSAGGVDVIELFGVYIEVWIQDSRLKLLEICKSDKARWMAATIQSERHSSSPFVEDMYQKIKETLSEYESIMSRWPEYVTVLENALCDVERGIVAALEKQYAEYLAPLGEAAAMRKFNLSQLHILARRRASARYVVPRQLGVVLNSIKRLLETLRPKMEAQMKVWVASLPSEISAGKAVFGDRLNEVTVELRAKYKSLLSAIIDKQVENTRVSRSTNLKRILQDMRAKDLDDVAKRMQPLVQLLGETITSIDQMLSSRVFVAICRGYWDRMARDVLDFLENRKENVSWIKSSSAGMALEILDKVFTQHIQRLQGHALQEKDLEPPRSVMEARSMLARDMPNGLSESYSLF
ncbi:hypothetical protein CBR_g39880 [Chara braunii]|uniref:MHD1 domain-containing protein n=1 Tax=Chara braunii TaxID=69332 RepID=A0A388LSV4_CHABU|nr:hypothetical protein CBR_g39880 [Chara braunii]|eukprot:GBG85313.1 hypothetical protein CBR_g39880 [Chara braunii]